VGFSAVPGGGGGGKRRAAVLTAPGPPPVSWLVGAMPFSAGGGGVGRAGGVFHHGPVAPFTRFRSIQRVFGRKVHFPKPKVLPCALPKFGVSVSVEIDWEVAAFATFPTVAIQATPLSTQNHSKRPVPFCRLVHNAFLIHYNDISRNNKLILTRKMICQSNTSPFSHQFSTK
jgi:hypothetical protein